MYDVVVIGGGIIGVSAAYELSKYKLSVALLEKNNDIADETTKANSAILHAGYDPMPGSLMAKTNVRGSKLAKELCKSLDVPYNQIGSLVLGFTDEDEETIKELFRRGQENQVPNLKILTQKELREMEPNVSEEAKLALYAPTAAVVNPWEYAIAIAEAAANNGVEIHLNSEVQSVKREGEVYNIKTPNHEIKARFVINAAGLYADKVHDMVSPHKFTIQPVKGEYYLLDKAEGERVNHVVFQCPTKAGKGVLVSPTVHGNLLVGPDATPQESRQNVGNSAEGLDFIRKSSEKSVPSVDFRKSIRNFAGLRAAPIGYKDFIIEKAADNWIDLAGIQSPGLTAAPAIAELAVDMLKEEGLELTKKKSFISTRKQVRFSSLSKEEKKELIAKDPAYGRIICRCEQITEGEIRQALRSPLTPPSIDAVKRRCNAGMGRCQGSFCGPRVLQLICEEKHCEPEEVMQDHSGSYLVLGKTKQGGEKHV